MTAMPLRCLGCRTSGRPLTAGVEITTIDVAIRRRLDPVRNSPDPRADLYQSLDRRRIGVSVAREYLVGGIFVPAAQRIFPGDSGLAHGDRRRAFPVGEEPLMRPHKRVHELRDRRSVGDSPSLIHVQRGELKKRHFIAWLAEARESLIGGDIVQGSSLKTGIDLTGFQHVPTR